MYIQTKKVVIVYIVTLVVLLSIIGSLLTATKAQGLNVAVVTAEELSYNNSFAQNIFSRVSSQIAEDNGNREYTSTANIYQITDNRGIQLDSIVSNNDISIIVGDKFNDYLTKLIEHNPQKQFVLIENGSTFSEPNVVQINLDYEQLFDSIDRRTDEDSQSLVILSDEFSSVRKDKYINSQISSNPDSKLLIISNTSDNVKIKSQITDALNSGYTNVYAIAPYNNQVIADVISKYNEDLRTSKSHNNSQPAVLNYLSLNSSTDSLADDTEYLNAVQYDISPQLAEIIKQRDKRQSPDEDDYAVELSNM